MSYTQRQKDASMHTLGRISARDVLTYTILFIPKSPREYIHQVYCTFVAIGYWTRDTKISLSGDLSSGYVRGIVDDGVNFPGFRDSLSS